MRNSDQKLKGIKRMTFRQYIHGFYDDIMNSPLKNKDIPKKLLNCDKN